MSDVPAQLMQCMEVWGGNRPVDAGVEMKGLDAWVHCRPWNDADGGGDVYYVSGMRDRADHPPAAGRRERAWVGGQRHRHHAARLDAKVRELSRSNAARPIAQQPVTALSENGRFATAVAITFFGPTRQLTLCNAGHPPPLLYRSRQRRWEVLHPGACGANFPWGIVDGCDYDQLQLPLEVDDLLLCYTDSLPEACTPAREQLGTEGLAELVRNLDCSAPSRLIPSCSNRCALPAIRPMTTSPHSCYDRVRPNRAPAHGGP